MSKARKSKYIRQLAKMYTGIPQTKRQKADELIRRLADVLDMMDECKAHLREEGCVTEMQQGDYTIMRENPYSKVYDAKHKLMLSTIEKLDKMQPEDVSKKDELMEFLDDAG